MGQEWKAKKPADVAEPMSVKQFLFALKRGTIFPAAAISKACDELPQELRDMRKTWNEWMAEFKGYM